MKMNAEESNTELNKGIVQILKGSVIAVILAVVLLFVFSLILTYTSLSENTIVPIIIIITAISILIGSSISSAKIKKNGLLNGAAIGGIYMIVFYLISSIVSGSFALNTSAIIMLISGIIAGILRWNSRCKHEIAILISLWCTFLFFIVSPTVPITPWLSKATGISL